MTAINHDSQQDAVGTASVEQGVKGSPHGATGEEDVVDEDDDLAVDAAVAVDDRTCRKLEAPL